VDLPDASGDEFGRRVVGRVVELSEILGSISVGISELL
jgi:hypothetical protein